MLRKGWHLSTAVLLTALAIKLRNCGSGRIKTWKERFVRDVQQAQFLNDIGICPVMRY